MGSEDLMMGQLIAGLAQNTDAVKDLADNVKELTQAHGSHATQLAELRKDMQNQSDEIKEVKLAVHSNESAKSLLLNMGMTPDDPTATRECFDFIRMRKKEVAEQKQGWGKVKANITTIVIATLCGFMLNVMIDGLSSKSAKDLAATAKQSVSNVTNESMINGQGGDSGK